MALSDVCSDTIHSLADDLVNYADWGYSAKQVLHVVDAMYNLAELGFSLDIPPDFVHPNPDLAIHNIVLGAILEADDVAYEEAEEAKLKMLADLSNNDARTAEGLDLIYKDVVENPESITKAINPNILEQLNRITNYKH